AVFFVRAFGNRTASINWLSATFAVRTRTRGAGCCRISIGSRRISGTVFQLPDLVAVDESGSLFLLLRFHGEKVANWAPDVLMTKTHILEEIRRTAKTNGGEPLGWRRFETETGIRQSDWSRFWARWGDAIREAGFVPNEFGSAYENSKLFECFAKLA